jgi:hypothetical protein
MAAMFTMSESFAPSETHRFLEAHDQRSNDGRAAQFLQHAGRDSGGVEGRHDEHVRRVFQPAERIGGHQLLIERDVGAHFAVVLEVNPLGVRIRTASARSSVRRADGEGGEGKSIATRGHNRAVAPPAASIAISAILGSRRLEIAINNQNRRPRDRMIETPTTR